MNLTLSSGLFEVIEISLRFRFRFCQKKAAEFTVSTKRRKRHNQLELVTARWQHVPVLDWAAAVGNWVRFVGQMTSYFSILFITTRRCNCHISPLSPFSPEEDMLNIQRNRYRAKELKSVAREWNHAEALRFSCARFSEESRARAVNCCDGISEPWAVIPTPRHRSV